MAPTTAAGRSSRSPAPAPIPRMATCRPSAFTWRVDFHHDDHSHPHVAPTSGITTGTFTIANRGETSANVFYRVILTVRDSSGLTHTSSVDVRPLTSVVRIESNVTERAAHARWRADHRAVHVHRRRRRHPHAGRGDAADLGRHHLRLRVLVRWRRGDARDRDAQRRHDVHGAVPAGGDAPRVFSDNFESGARLDAHARRAIPATTGPLAARRSAADDLERHHAAARTPATVLRSTASSPVSPAGSAAGSNDVDGGQTSVQSPAIALPAGGTHHAVIPLLLRAPEQRDQRGLSSAFAWWGTMASRRRCTRGGGTASNVAGSCGRRGR